MSAPSPLESRGRGVRRDGRGRVLHSPGARCVLKQHRTQRCSARRSARCPQHTPPQERGGLVLLARRHSRPQNLLGGKIVRARTLTQATMPGAPLLRNVLVPRCRRRAASAPVSTPLGVCPADRTGAAPSPQTANRVVRMDVGGEKRTEALQRRGPPRSLQTAQRESTGREPPEGLLLGALSGRRR